MKSIERIVSEKYHDQQSLPQHKQLPANCFIDWAKIGAREVQRWISIDDRENPIPDDEDFLIKLENGSIRRFKENWEEEFGLDGIVTHWRPFERV